MGSSRPPPPDGFEMPAPPSIPCHCRTGGRIDRRSTAAERTATQKRGYHSAVIETSESVDGFRPRGREVSRIEAFSDVVFGFALTLLVVSLEVPKTIEDFMAVLHDFVPFAICFFLFIQIWHSHYLFFRRYGLQDSRTLFLNTLLLFVVLFYVYPLKFIFTLVFSSNPQPMTISQGRTLYSVYALGVVAVFFLIASMYGHAYRLREALALSEIERIDTRSDIFDNLGTGAVGLVSLLIAIAAPPGKLGFAGWIYFAIAIPKTLVPMYFGRERRRLLHAAPDPNRRRK